MKSSKTPVSLMYLELDLIWTISKLSTAVLASFRIEEQPDLSEIYRSAGTQGVSLSKQLIFILYSHAITSSDYEFKLHLFRQEWKVDLHISRSSSHAGTLRGCGALVFGLALRNLQQTHSHGCQHEPRKTSKASFAPNSTFQSPLRVALKSWDAQL